MKFYLSILLIACYACIAQAQRLHFRTDGYYFYDNKCDTLFLMDIKSKNNQQWVAMIKNSGLVVDDSVSCAPRNALPLSGSSIIKILAFFSDAKGCYFSSACWTEPVHASAITKINLLKKKQSIKGSVGEYLFVESIKKDNTFIAKQSGPNVHTQKILSGRILLDRIIIREHYLQPGFADDKVYTYYFYPFSKVPPFRNSLKFVYRDPSKWNR